MDKPPKSSPWLPPEYDIADTAAIQALARGDANAEQQPRALKWIVEALCRTYDLSFRPDSQRETDFAEGKRFVGLQIVKHTKLNTQLLRKDNARSRSHPDAGPGSPANTSPERTVRKPGTGPGDSPARRRSSRKRRTKPK